MFLSLVFAIFPWDFRLKQKDSSKSHERGKNILYYMKSVMSFIKLIWYERYGKGIHVHNVDCYYSNFYINLRARNTTAKE